jgi:hypothetical protein
MTVYCDGCGEPLPPNDDSIYTQSGGAWCEDCRATKPRKIKYVVKVEIEKVTSNRHGIVESSLEDLSFLSEVALRSRKAALSIAEEVSQRLLQMDDSQRSITERPHRKP